MIKLIVSDVDGTLIQDRSNKISDQVFELIEECHASGIKFAVASGRQYNNLKRLFAPVWEEIYFIPENGNLIVYQEEILHKVVFPPDLAQELITYLEAAPHCELVISTPFSLFIKPDPAWLVDIMLRKVGYTTTCIPDFSYLRNEDVLKISAFAEKDKREILTKTFRKEWDYNLQVTQSGGPWIDFSLSGKGAAVRRLADGYKITPDQIMVFGDNYNDEELFAAAKHSFCMASSNDYLKSKATYTTPTVEEVIIRFLQTGEI